MSAQQEKQVSQNVIDAIAKYLPVTHNGDLSECPGCDCEECENYAYVLAGEIELSAAANEAFGMDFSDTVRCRVCGMPCREAVKNIPGGTGRIMLAHLDNIECELVCHDSTCACENPVLTECPTELITPSETPETPESVKLEGLRNTPIDKECSLKRLLKVIQARDYHGERARKVTLVDQTEVSAGSYLDVLGTGADFIDRIQTLDIINQTPLTFSEFAIVFLTRKIKEGTDTNRALSEGKLREDYTKILTPIYSSRISNKKC